MFFAQQLRKGGKERESRVLVSARSARRNTSSRNRELWVSSFKAEKPRVSGSAGGPNLLIESIFGDVPGKARI